MFADSHYTYMDEKNTAEEAGQVKKLLEKNLKLTEEIYKMSKSIKSFMMWQKIFGFLKILIIVVPIVIGILYLPPLLKNVFEQYQGLLGIEGDGGNIIENLLKSGAGGLDLNNIDADKLPPEAQKYLK